MITEKTIFDNVVTIFFRFQRNLQEKIFFKNACPEEITPMEKKCKKAKWLSGEALQIAVKRREEKRKEEKERYKHLNAEF